MKDFTWSEHVNKNTSRKAVCYISAYNGITVYTSIIEPYFSYFSLAWESISQTLSNKIQRLQNQAAAL